MATTIKSTELDFATIKNNLKTNFERHAEFSDYNFEGSGLSNILDVLATNTHYNALIANFALNESYLSTAQLRSSLVSLAEGIGYIPKSKTASRGTVTLTTNTGDLSGRPSTLSLPTGTKFTATVDDVTYTFQTRETVTATDNGFGYYAYKTPSSSLNIDVLEGHSHTKTFFVGPDSVDDVYVIPDKNIDMETAIVKVYESSTDTTFANYINISKASTINENTKLYIMKEAPNGFYEITFGDGVTLGKAPVAGNKIVIEYLQVNGSKANGATAWTANNRISVLGTNYDVTPVTVVNSLGGAEAETMASIRKNAPFQYATQNRMVTAVDYSTLVLSNFGTIIKDIQAFGGEDALKPEFGTVFLSIVFNADVTAETIATTKNSIVDLTKQLAVVGFDTKFEDPVTTFVETEIFFQFNPKLGALSLTTVQDNVQVEIDRYFTENIGKFNQSFRRSNLLNDVDEVDTAVLSSRANIKLQRRFTPTTNTLQDHTLRYPVGIAEADDKDIIVKSTPFNFNGTTCNIQNKLGSNKLQIVALGSKIVQSDNIGSYNSATGIVSIVGLNVNSVIGGNQFIKVSVVPANQSAVSPLRNDILEYDSGPSFATGVVVSTT
jgi:hypothetical protein|tara:strand:+ start:4050 stop:5873 length:1824 start_codon:yes stop_codon:yes gene_type:complete